MKDKKRTRRRILFHEVLSFVDFAKSKFLQEKFFDLFILYERREGKMRLETLKNECFIIDCFFLYYFSEIFIDLIIIHNPQCSHLSRLSFSLHEIWFTSSSWGSVLTLSSLRSISELNSLLSFLSWLSII